MAGTPNLTIFDRPMAITEPGLSHLLAYCDGTVTPVRASDDDDLLDLDDDKRGYTLSSGIATVRIHGPLLKSDSVVSRWLGLATYESIRRSLTDALADPQVTGIILDCDTPGGEAAGMLDLADYIYSMRGRKVLIAVANDAAFSAGYAIASAASRVVVSRDGGAGSIGCVCCHLDRSGLDQQLGLKYRYIYAPNPGSKIDGNPHEPLSTSAAATIQKEVSRCAETFIHTVARNRGVSAQAIRDTQSQIYFAGDCLPLLGDAVASLENASDELAWRLGSRTTVAVSSRPQLSASAPPQSITGRQAALDTEANCLDRLMQSGPPAGYRAALPSENQQIPAETVAQAVVRASAIGSSIVLGPRARGTDRTIRMTPVPYNRPSTQFEIYRPGCFDSGLSGDIFCFLNHNEDLALGRVSAGNMRVYSDAIGVHCECDLPDVSYADDLLATMRAGIVTGSSAGFWITRSHYETLNGDRYRVIDKAVMREVAPCAIPSYPAATAQLSASNSNELAACRLRLLQAAEPAPIASNELAAARLRLLKLS